MDFAEKVTKVHSQRSPVNGQVKTSLLKITQKYESAVLAIASQNYRMVCKKL